jgi:hypothetical protein
MDDRQLRAWVGDQLHALLGFAEGSLAAYVVALGQCGCRVSGGGVYGGGL